MEMVNYHGIALGGGFVKINYGKVYVKQGKGSVAVDAGKVEIGSLTLADMLNEFNELKEAQNAVVSALEKSIVIQRDKEYIIEIGGELKRVRNPKFHDNEDGDLKWLKLENGKIVKDKRKVGAL